MLKRFELENWESITYDDRVLITAESILMNDRYRIFVKMESKVYEDLFRGSIFLDEIHWSEEQQSFVVDKRHSVGYLCDPTLTGIPLKMAKKIAEAESKKIYKNILRNSFTK